MNKLNTLFTICMLLSIAFCETSPIWAMNPDDDRDQKTNITKLTTFTNRTNNNLWFRIIEQDPNKTQIFSIRGGLPINAPVIISSWHDPEFQKVVALISYDQLYSKAVTQPLTSESKHYVIVDKGFGLLIEE